MRYLRLIRQNLESSENTTQTPNRPPQQNESDTSSEVATSSIFSTARSRTSSRTASTTNSDVFLDIPIEDSAPYREFTGADFLETIIFIARRITWERFEDITTKAFSRVQSTLAIQNVYRKLNLTGCSVPKAMNEFEEVRRCHGCDTQLCRDCEHCILKNCVLVPEQTEPKTPTNLDILAAAEGLEAVQLASADGVEWQPRDSLAAKRIATTCHRDTRYRYKISNYYQCRCTDFLVKPGHTCDSGEFHFCKGCYERVVDRLAHSNMKTITYRTPREGEVRLAQYTCPAGHPCDQSAALCKICLGTYAKAVVNDVNSVFKFNGSDEGKVPRWNNGVCRCMFSLIPGLEGSFLR